MVQLVITTNVKLEVSPLKEYIQLPHNIVMKYLNGVWCSANSLQNKLLTCILNASKNPQE